MTDPMGHTLSDLVRRMYEVATARLPGRPRTVVLKFTRATLQQWLDRVQQALTRHDALCAAAPKAHGSSQKTSTSASPHHGEGSPVRPSLAEEHAMSPSTACGARRPDTSPGDPTAVPRQQRQQARRAHVDGEVVIEALVQLVRDTMFEETNALTLALRDTCAHPPQDRWALDQGLTDVPYRTRAELGLAFLRLCGEAWLHGATGGEEARC